MKKIVYLILMLTSTVANAQQWVLDEIAEEQSSTPNDGFNHLLGLGEAIILGGAFLVVAIVLIYKIMNGTKERIERVLNPPLPEQLSIKEPYYYGWSRVYFKKKFLFVNENGLFLKCGYNPEQVLQHQASLFDTAGDFQNGRSIVCIGDRSALIDSTGKYIIPFETGLKMRTAIVDIFSHKNCHSIYIYHRDRHIKGDMYESLSKEVVRYDGKVLYKDKFDEIKFIDAEHFEIVKGWRSHTILNINGELELPFHDRYEIFEDGNVLLHSTCYVALYDKGNKKFIFDFDRDYVSLKYFAKKKWYIGSKSEKHYPGKHLCYEITTPTESKKLYYDYYKIYDNCIVVEKTSNNKRITGVVDLDLKEIIAPKYSEVVPTEVNGIYLAYNIFNTDSFKDLKYRANFFVVDAKGNESKIEGHPLSIKGHRYPYLYYNKIDNSILTFEGKVIVPSKPQPIYPIKEDYMAPDSGFYREIDGSYEIYHLSGQIETTSIEPENRYIKDENGHKHEV